MTPLLLNATPTTPKAATAWRTTVVGALVIVFACVRILFKHDAVFDAETGSLFIGGCGLILGSDKLLGR